MHFNIRELANMAGIASTINDQVLTKFAQLLELNYLADKWATNEEQPKISAYKQKKLDAATKKDTK